MPTPLLSINDFSAGILDDETAQAGNGFQVGVEIDIHDKKGILRPSFGVSQESTMSSLIRDIDNYNNGTTENLYGATGSAMYKRSGGSWSLDRSFSGVTPLSEGPDVVTWNGSVWYTSKFNLGKLNVTTYADTYLTATLGESFPANDAAWKPMKPFLDKLYIGDGRYISTLDTAEVWDQTALTLPTGYRIRTMEVIGDRLAIACGGDSLTSGGAEFSTVFFWDGTSDLYESKVEVDAIGGIQAMKEVDNILYLFARNVAPPAPAGIDLFFYNGSDFELIKTVNNAPGETDSVFMNRNAVANYNNNLIFGTSRDSGGTSQLHGIWKWGRKNRNDPRSLILENLCSDGTESDVEIGAIKTIDNVYVFSNTTGSTNRVDVLSTTTANSNARMESQVYELNNDDQKTLIKGVKVFMRPLAASTSAVVKYDIDESGSYTTLGTITSTNQDNILYGIYKRGDTIRLRIEMNSNGTDRPEIYKINLY